MEEFDDSKIIQVCGTLAFSLEQNCRKGIFSGRWKPTNSQLAFCFGFIDAITQDLGMEQEEALANMLIIFNQLFGPKAETYVGKVIRNQMNLRSPMMEGGQASIAWASDGILPKLPLY